MTQQPIDSGITSDDKLWAALGYPIFIIALIMLLIQGKRDRPFIKFHAVQALAVFVVYFVVVVVVGILRTIFSRLTSGLCGLAGCIDPILWLLLLWPAILAYQGKYFDIPVLTKFLRDQHWVA